MLCEGLVFVPDAETTADNAVFIVTAVPIPAFGSSVVYYIPRNTYRAVGAFLDNQWTDRIRPLFLPDADGDLPIWEDDWLQKLREEFQNAHEKDAHKDRDVSNTIYMFLCGYVPGFPAKPRTRDLNRKRRKK